MKSKNCVSIIIPTYNRAHLISETLDSILAQTYANWECIIVDDGSTDNTTEVVAAYVKKDNRFQYHERPQSHKPGGNGARNYGLKQSKGDYIIWFDSDDLMEQNKIKTHIQVLTENDCQFSVAKFLNFETKQDIAHNFVNVIKDGNLYPVKREDYVTQKIFWGTIDVVAKKELYNGFHFNEELKSGQEYNFFVNVLAKAKNSKGLFLNDFLAFRRIHANSIQETQFKNTKLLIVNKFKVYYHTFQEVNSQITVKEKKYLLKKMIVKYVYLIKEIEFQQFNSIIVKHCKENFSYLQYLQIKYFLMYLKYNDIGTNKIQRHFKKIL
jgi:glycosyltransferase involved in cell wall biosynthesis